MYEVFPQMQKIVLCSTEKINIIEKILSDLEDKVNDLTRQNEEMARRNQGLNITDILKGNSGNLEGLNLNGEEGNNILLNLISSLENKMDSSSKFTEERINKLEESNYKLQRETRDLKNAQESNRRTLNILKETTEDIILNLKNLHEKIKDTSSDLDKNLEMKMKSLQKDEQKFDSKLEDKDNKDGKDLANSSGTERILDLENNETIIEIKKRISDLEKIVKQMPGHMGIEQMKSDISALKSGISNCAQSQELKDAKEKQDEMQRQLSFLKDQFDEFVSNTADHDDIQNLKRKLEFLNGKFQEIDTIQQDILTKMSKSVITKTHNITIDKYLDIQRFEDFKAQIIKEFTSVNDNFTHLRRLVDNILDTLKNKPSYRDIKALEEELLVKFEELKVSCAKKFAERIETTKNLKYLDQQIKNILQVYIKKDNKSDNWLLAKRPLNGNLCASCEAYIGDLKDNSLYQPWNKYSLKDSNDKFYRLGNGFSKMLQMVHSDENDKKNLATVPHQNSNNDLNNLVKNDKLDGNLNTITNMNMGPIKTDNNNSIGGNKSLPKIKPNNTGSNFVKGNNFRIKKNISENDFPPQSPSENAASNEEKPKITKIVKVDN